MSDLKPCPFCGNAPAREKDGEYHVICCSGCRAEVSSTSKRELDALWDRRAAALEGEPGELERLRAENERLREGLKPFSEEAAAWVDHMPDGEPLWISLGPGFDPMPSKISINNLRRARAALAEGGRDE